MSLGTEFEYLMGTVARGDGAAAAREPLTAYYAASGDTAFTSAVFPKDGRHLVRLRATIRKAEGSELGRRGSTTVRLIYDRGIRRDQPRP